MPKRSPSSFMTYCRYGSDTLRLLPQQVATATAGLSAAVYRHDMRALWLGSSDCNNSISMFLRCLLEPAFAVETCPTMSASSPLDQTTVLFTSASRDDSMW